MATYTDNKDVDWGATDSLIYALGGDDEISSVNPISVEMYGGSGNDDLSYGEMEGGTPFNGTVVLHGDSGNDQLDDGAGAGTSYLYGDDGNDVLDSDRSTGPSHLYGGAGNDELMAGSGDVLIDKKASIASAGVSFLYGGEGKDDLYIDSNSNTLDGGSGRDKFYFGKNVDNASIMNFSRVDTIDLSDIDARTKSKGNQSFEFIGKDAFQKKAGELKFGKDILKADTDGDGRADVVIQVKGDNVTESDLNL